MDFKCFSSFLSVELLFQNLFDDDRELFIKLVKKAEINYNKQQLRSQIERLQSELESLDSDNIEANPNLMKYYNNYIVAEEEKVGEIANTKLRYVLESGRLNKGEIEKLKDPFYCKKTFNLNYPLLSKERLDHRGYARYYKKPVYIDGEEYFLCSHWVQNNLLYLQNWLRKYYR